MNNDESISKVDEMIEKHAQVALVITNSAGPEKKLQAMKASMSMFLEDFMRMMKDDIVESIANLESEKSKEN
jgi:hypothetical protein